jgi:hypothetical protein
MLPGTSSENLLYLTFGCGGTCVVSYPDKKLYETPFTVLSCGYDNQGNLFVGGFADASGALAELPYGGSSFATLSVSEKVYNLGTIQWDGQYLSVEGYMRRNRFCVDAVTFVVRGTTEL